MENSSNKQPDLLNKNVENNTIAQDLTYKVSPSNSCSLRGTTKYISLSLNDIGMNYQQHEFNTHEASTEPFRHA